MILYGLQIFVKRKRPEWFIDIAEKLPDYNFAMIGASLDDELFEECYKRSKKLENLEILGYLDFHETTKMISQSIFLVCTAEYEGFPNTFLQSWAHGVPIISTVNPNKCFTKFKIGYFVSDLDDLINICDYYMKRPDEIKKLKKPISEYFLNNHRPSVQYSKFRSSLSIK